MEELDQDNAAQLPPERKKKLSEMTFKECSGAGEKLKWLLNYVFIDGMSGMALGLFATLIAGTILWQLGSLIDKAGNNPFGLALEAVGKAAQIAMGAGIGVGVCLKLKKTQPLVVASAVAAGMIGSYAQAIISGIRTSMESGNAFAIALSSAGDPMGAFVGAFAAMTLASLVSGRTRVDILVTPLVGLAGGALFGIGVGYPVSLALTELGNFIAWAASLSTVSAAVTGLIVSVVMGVALTLPISSAAIGISIGLSGVAAGAAVVGCCCQMMGFAPIISSAILGTLSVFLPNGAGIGLFATRTGSGMGTAGLVGPIDMLFEMIGAQGCSVGLTILWVVLFCFVLPALLTLAVAELFRKLKIIKYGDLTLKL